MGFLAATPFLVKALSGPFGGITADLLQRRGLSTRSVRRLYFAVGKDSLETLKLAVSLTRSDLPPLGLCLREGKVEGGGGKE